MTKDVISKLSTHLLRELPVSAASGLVKIKNDLYVIADDELSLTQFRIDDPKYVRHTPLLSGTLPSDFRERKKVKPDWESLCIISQNHLNGILAFPSGSTTHREVGIFMNLNADTTSSAGPIKIDFSKIFAFLRRSVKDLNIEGAVIFQNHLKLFQRGNGAQGTNAIINLDLNGFCHDVEKQLPINSNRLLNIKPIDLGELKNVKLGFTDACVAHEKIWFLAVAENSNSTYEDGQFCGAVLGSLDANDQVVLNYELNCTVKPEGLWVEYDQPRLFAYFVTDADDPNSRSKLYSVSGPV